MLFTTARHGNWRMSGATKSHPARATFAQRAPRVTGQRAMRPKLTTSGPTMWSELVAAPA
jgi:hypothetical protein